MYLEYKFNNQSDLPIYISHDLYDFERTTSPNGLACCGGITVMTAL